MLVVGLPAGISAADSSRVTKLLDGMPPDATVVLVSETSANIPERVQDRCDTLTFRALPHGDAVALLAAVCDKEGIVAERAALDLLAWRAEGRALPLLRSLEQLNDFGEVSLVSARDLFGFGHLDHIPRVWLSLLRDDLPSVIDTLAAWDQPPAGIADLCRGFLLWLQCRERRPEVVINPAFSALAVTHVRAVRDALDEKARAAGLGLEDVFAIVGGALGSEPVPDLLTLQLIFRDLSSLIRGGFGEVHEEGVAPAPKGHAATRSGGRRRGRQFVSTFINRDGVAAVAGPTAPPVSAPVPGPPASSGFQLAPAIGGPVFASPPTAIPPAAPLPDAAVQPPAEVGDQPKLEPGSTGGEFAWKPPELPPKRKLYAHDLTMAGWSEAKSGVDSVFRAPPSD